MIRHLVVLVLAPAVCASVASCQETPPPPPPSAPARLVPPLCDAAIGEELHMKRADEDWIWRVTSATGHEVEVEFRRFRDGVALGPAENLVWSRNLWGLPPGYRVDELARDRLEVGGRAWDCWRMRAVSPNDLRWYWFTEELPVSGFLRVARDDRGKPELAFAATVIPEACSFGK